MSGVAPGASAPPEPSWPGERSGPSARQVEGRPAWVDRVAPAVAAEPPPFFSRFAAAGRGGRHSAVLLLFGPRPGGGQDVVLTERSHGMRSHPGQVSFPGGAVEAHDAGPAAAALREAHEEVGIDPSGVDVVAELTTVHLAVSRFVVTPVLGWWREPAPLGPLDSREVRRAVRMPLDHLLDPHVRFTVTHPSGYVGPGFEVDGLFVWGFTAGLLSAVLEMAGLERPWDRGVRRELPRRFRPGGLQDGLAQAAVEGSRS